MIKAGKEVLIYEERKHMMQIGEIIRKYRKVSNLTQEEMANRLGVTAPAVNKWENGNSCPDIMMLAPIARLLHISLDTLLSFQADLSEAEIRAMIQYADEQVKKEPFEKVFVWAKKKIEEYPNCHMLIWQLAVLLDGQRLVKDVPNSEKYDDLILNWYKRALECEDEKVKTCAADSLFGYFLRKEEYEEAESYLCYYSEQNPERKRKQAVIYSKTGRREAAYKEYEELLFSEYQMLSMIFHSIYMLAIEDGNRKKAHALVEKQQELARLFEMGIYYEVSCQLELAVLEQNTEAVIEIAQKMLSSADKITSFTEAALYEHMTFKKVEKNFAEELRKNLIEQFQDEDTFGFLKAEERMLICSEIDCTQ